MSLKKEYLCFMLHCQELVFMHSDNFFYFLIPTRHLKSVFCVRLIFVSQEAFVHYKDKMNDKLASMLTCYWKTSKKSV